MSSYWHLTNCPVCFLLDVHVANEKIVYAVKWDILNCSSLCFSTEGAFCSALLSAAMI